MIAMLLLILSLALTAQALFSVYLMLYTWEDSDRAERSHAPREFVPPRLSFTALLPAKDEEAVIYQTIQRVWAANYPRELLEICVVCHASDTATIREAERAVAAIGAPQVRVAIFDALPINKPHGLNFGLSHTQNQVITVFDAEDDIAPEIFNVVNTIMVQERVGIVQGGVQLMNFRSHWFSIHNCLEYFFWFKSRLHFHARVGMIPLGGNTVFFRRRLIERVGGWDEQCLTEDADIGLRLSALGEPIRVFYDAHLSTREETPETMSAFIKQRTRWHQGFLQVLRKATWRQLATWQQCALAFYSLAYPWFQGAMLVITPLTFLLGFFIKIPLVVALASFLPLYVFALQALLTIAGAFVFTREYKQELPWHLPISMALTFIPYQILQGIGAVRAIWREIQGHSNWEKTAHSGAHR